jgi:divinyl protochlorophyllide a 8-vinyl-reductase
MPALDIPRIGPNAILQTRRALAELEGSDEQDALFRRMGLPEPLPPGMIPERWFLGCVETLRDALPADRAEAVLARSGAYTADYVRENRIPRPFRALLGHLPVRVALPLLLFAFRRHAWTFAGAGRFSVEGAFPGTLVLEGCPTCRVPTRAEHGGAYYEAAFAGLLAIAAPGVRVREKSCVTRGADRCTFEITLAPQASRRS